MQKNSPHILVIEDDAALREALTDKLTREGFQVSSASDGEKGLELALESQPDLILLDIAMPLMNGMEVLKELRQDQRGKSIKVMMLTNTSSTEKIAESMESEIVGYFIKSDWPLEKLVEDIKKVLS